MNAITMNPISAHHFDSAQTQWAMPHSPYVNGNYAVVENTMRHRTSTSGSGSDGQDIIPGGEFDDPDLQHHRSGKKSSAASRSFVRPNDTMALPQTPQHRSCSNNQGMSGSSERNVYRNVSYSTPGHYNRSGGGDSAMDSIGERTKRMNILSTTPVHYLSSSSPTSMSMMQPSAFRLAGVPMTPDPGSAFGNFDIGNDDAPSQSMHFSSTQPQVMQFVPGPPQHMHVEHQGSAFPFVNSFNGQSNGSFIPQSFRGPVVPSIGLPLSTSTRSDLTTATSGYPGTPPDPNTFGFQDSNTFAYHIKTEPGEAMTATENDSFQQQQGSTQHQTHMPSSPGQSSSFDNRRHFHPYRLAQTDPMNRIASMPAILNYSPGTPTVFAFSHPLTAMANSDSSPTPVQQSQVISGTANPSNIHSRHQHSGSLAFRMPSSMTTIEGGVAAAAPPLYSMSLPNHGMSRNPVSPGGESLRSEGDSEFDDEWSGVARQPRAPRPMPMFGSPRHGSSNGPRLAKNHICHLCGKAFNRPSSLNTHMAVHTGAKPFQCPKRDCGRKFSVSSNLRRHMKTHTINEQARVAQLTARDLAAQSHFEVVPTVKQEPEDHPTDDILEEEERELENGSIVYDDNGRAYRYYDSESAYQAATAGDLSERPLQDQTNQWTGHHQQQQTSPGALISNNGVCNQDSPFVSMHLESSLGNAAPPVSFSPSMLTESRNGQHHRELAAPFEQWIPGNEGVDISAGVSLRGPLMLGDASAAIQRGN